MKKSKFLTAAIFCTIIFSCGSKTVQLDFTNVPDNERCQYMKDVCREAEKFQDEYSRMSREEREDAKAVLNAYIEQCTGAQEMCRATK